MPYRPLAPDLLLTGGTIYSMDALDRVATALAIKDGRIVGIGLDEEMRSLAGLGTIEESLEGKTVVPGLIDAHNHLLFTGFLLQDIQLYDCRSIPESRSAGKRAPGSPHSKGHTAPPTPAPDSRFQTSRGIMLPPAVRRKHHGTLTPDSP